MIRLNITAEGYSEERFVKDLIYPHLLQFGIYTNVRKILTSRKLKKRGGIVSYGKFRNDVVQWLKEDADAYHSTLIDLYGLSTDFPGVVDSKGNPGQIRVEKIEGLLAEDISYPKFLPYVQPYEYESLLFSDPERMYEWLSLYDKLPRDCFRKIRNSVSHPEEINDSPETAPSKRIVKLCSSYDKVDDGILILKEIGLQIIRDECPHFNKWLTRLESLR